MRINADRERCAGSGQCVLTEPGVFDQDAGLVPLRTERTSAAVHSCPPRALAVIGG